MEKLGWGVLGSARIARKKMMPAIMASATGRLVGLASRDLQRAREGLQEAIEEAGARGIVPSIPPKAYGSYQDVLMDSEVNAVYIPLPNHEHLPWAIRALEAGKHVLLEKPGLMNGAEAKQLNQAANRFPLLYIAEGFMFRFHPQWQMVKDWIDGGKIGTLRNVNIQFSFFSDDPSNIRNRPETGGGALLDLGGYALAASRFIFGREPIGLKAEQELDSMGVDWQTRGELCFDQSSLSERTSGPLTFRDFNTREVSQPYQYGYALFSTNIRSAYFQRIDISGTEGRIAMERPFSPIFSEGVRPLLYGRQGQLLLDPDPIFADHFILQLDDFAFQVKGRRNLASGLVDLSQQGHLMDLVRESAIQREWMAVN